MHFLHQQKVKTEDIVKSFIHYTTSIPRFPSYVGYNIEFSSVRLSFFKFNFLSDILYTIN